MDKTFSLYSLNLNKIVSQLKLGEMFDFGNNVILRVLDSKGKIFIESKNQGEDAPIVILKDKAVIEIAQGESGDEFSINDHKYVLLAPEQIFITRNQLTLENIDKIHNFSQRALELIEDEAPQRPLQKISDSFNNFFKKTTSSKNKKSFKIAGAIIGIITFFVATLLLWPASKQNINSKVVVEKASAVKASETNKSLTDKPLDGIKNNEGVDKLKNELSLKREVVASWDKKLADIEKVKNKREKLNLYAEFMSGEKSGQNSSLWENYPKAKKVNVLWNKETKKIVKSLNHKKIKTRSKRSNHAFLLKHFDLLSDQNKKSIRRYERAINSRIDAAWVKAVFDPDTVREELTSISKLLPEDHDLQTVVTEKLNAL